MGNDGRDFARPLRSNSFWTGVGVLVVWTSLLVVFLFVNFQLDPPHTEQGFHAAIWGLIAASWSVAIIFYLVRSMSPARGSSPPPFIELQETLWREAHSMAQYALERGKTPEDKDLLTLQTISLKINDLHDAQQGLPATELSALTSAHKRLTALVAPAMPKTLALLSFRDRSGLAGTSDSDENTLAWLGQVRLVRMMLGLAILLLVLFIGLALAVGSRLDSSDGLFSGDIVQRTQTGCYLVVAAALGAAFAALFKARRYIERLSYDDQYESSYWVRFVQGLLSGLILSVLLSHSLPTGGDTSSDNTTLRLGVPLLALVGGFSSDLVYRILKRIIEAIETLISGSVSDELDAQAENHQARLRTQKMESDQLLKAKLLEGQRDEVTALLRIAQNLPAGTEGNAARAALHERISTVLESSKAVEEPSDGGLTQNPARGNEPAGDSVPPDASPSA